MSQHNYELKIAIEGICKTLDVSIDKGILKEYQNGKLPNLLSYEKVENSEIQLATIHKYLIGAQTIIDQPCTFFDINRLCRSYFFVQVLNRALNDNKKYVKNYEERFQKLCLETDYDPFEAILYELAVARAYSICPHVKDVTFLESKTTKAPEFEFTFNKRKIYVECKKFDRDADIVSKLRNDVRKKCQPTLHAFREINKSGLFELSFHVDPLEVTHDEIKYACIDSLRSRLPIINKKITVVFNDLKPQKYENYELYPSPKYFWNRYNYKNHSEWFGITSLFKVKYAYLHDIEKSSDYGASTWLDDIDFECVVKWKITNEDVLWKYRKLGYNLLFKGLEQLKTYGEYSILHAWFERDGFAGNRKKELLDFFSRIHRNQRDIFSWIIFNETILDVSTGGIFDLIEHSHPISGPSSNSVPPFVTSIFTHDEQQLEEIAEFGVGHNLPDIDEICKG